eukprot:Ihof_evm5s483 gene=Ihof_evmTU5s483
MGIEALGKLLSRVLTRTRIYSKKQAERMGIHGLTKLIGDNAPGGLKESDIKNYFGRK